LARLVPFSGIGTTISNLLFLVYINDISDGLTSPAKLFADDCAIFCQYRMLLIVMCWTSASARSFASNKKRPPPTYSYCVKNVMLE